jgi:hypothetical protein
VLLRVCANCTGGDEEIASQRITVALEEFRWRRGKRSWLAVAASLDRRPGRQNRTSHDELDSYADART